MSLPDKQNGRNNKFIKSKINAMNTVSKTRQLRQLCQGVVSTCTD